MTHVSKTTPQLLRRFVHARLLNRVKYHLRFHIGKSLSLPFYDQLFLAPIRNREKSSHFIVTLHFSVRIFSWRNYQRARKLFVADSDYSIFNVLLRGDA